MSETIKIQNSTVANSACGSIVQLTNSVFDPSSIAAVSTIYSDIAISNPYKSSTIVGDSSTDKVKLFIVEPWQSRKPIEIESGLFVSLEADMISDSELKYSIIKKLTEDHPDVLLKIGVDANNVKLVRKDVTLEINMG